MTTLVAYKNGQIHWIVGILEIRNEHTKVTVLVEVTVKVPDRVTVVVEAQKGKGNSMSPKSEPAGAPLTARKREERNASLIIFPAIVKSPEILLVSLGCSNMNFSTAKQ